MQDAPPTDWQQSAPGSSSGLDTVPPGLHASDAAWNAVFSTQSAAQEDSPRHYQHSREPGSPLHPAGSSGGGAGPVWHPMPYALMKVSCRLQANQSAPDWLQQVKRGMGVAWGPTTCCIALHRLSFPFNPSALVWLRQNEPHGLGFVSADCLCLGVAPVHCSVLQYASGLPWQEGHSECCTCRSAAPPHCIMTGVMPALNKPRYTVVLTLLLTHCAVPCCPCAPPPSQVMASEAVIPVEDWSKFIHGCAVLLPDIVRAVPYWMDDELVELSVSTLQAKLEAEEARRTALQQQQMQAHHQRNSSMGSFTGSISGRTSSGGLVEGAAAQEQQQQQPMLQRLSGSFRAVLTRAGSSGGGAGSRASHTGGSAGGSSGSNLVTPPQQQLEQQGLLLNASQGSHVTEPAFQASYANPTSSSSHKPSRLRVTSQDGTAGHRVSWADGGPHSSSRGGYGSTGGAEAAGTVVVSGGGWGLGVLGALWQLVHKKKKPPPLFRPEGSR